ncbi:PLP-dependent aminotransferase family protein [Komagataeibacter diospyri]|uniref:GntR family transcriptional regulator n=2 Tax=Komagataeibacter diospyri TaxID=1932662 RepID=A0A4P5NTJ0_9PROT|nr:GntR family transcriptional regulator [Komagataeibacter diospyri]GCE89106.1 GntR family transcriptional regulator [Komagataeibacter diospyri]
MVTDDICIDQAKGASIYEKFDLHIRFSYIIMNINIDNSSTVPLVNQIVSGVRDLILGMKLQTGQRLPSVRQLAEQCGVSTLTVSNAYNKLVAEGLLEARRARGYFVTHNNTLNRTLITTATLVDRSVDSRWLLQSAYEDKAPIIKAGCGWLPESYLFVDAIKQALVSLGRKPPSSIFEYGNPYGYTPLRHSIQLMLAQRKIRTCDAGIILTHGASQALELSVRAFTHKQDTVLVDDPGYCNLNPALQGLDLNVVGVPRTFEGPDIERLEYLARLHQPRLFITNTILHNPTGTSCSPANAFHILNLAEKYNFLIVEDDIFSSLTTDITTNLAYLDQMRRVIQVGSFSKTIAPGVRVGFTASHPELAQVILRQKMASSLTTSGINEYVIHSIIKDGKYRHHLTRLKERLERMQASVGRALTNTGMRLYFRPPGGMFVWARFDREGINMQALAQSAAEEDILLAPGYLFRPNYEPSPWMRFNVAHCNNPYLFDFLKKYQDDHC